MTINPADDQGDPNNEDDMRSEAMKNQLRSDVSSWKAGRSEESSRQAETAVSVTKPAPSRPATRAKTVKAVATKPADDKKKPFSMSYDGTTQADYITYMISRGAR